MFVKDSIALDCKVSYIKRCWQSLDLVFIKSFMRINQEATKWRLKEAVKKDRILSLFGYI
jgi:hypothetical protein